MSRPEFILSGTICTDTKQAKFLCSWRKTNRKNLGKNREAWPARKVKAFLMLKHDWMSCRHGKRSRSRSGHWHNTKRNSSKCTVVSFHAVALQSPAGHIVIARQKGLFVQHTVEPLSLCCSRRRQIKLAWRFKMTWGDQRVFILVGAFLIPGFTPKQPLEVRALSSCENV